MQPDTRLVSQPPEHGLCQPWLPLGLALLATIASLAGLANHALAAMNDPTRPPALALAIAAAASAPAGSAARAPASAPAAAAPPVLQAVQLPAHGAATAMIDGQLVKLGDSVGERTVASIERDTVVLRGPNGSGERLRLLSGSVKQMAGSIAISRSTSYGAADDPAAEPASSPMTRSRP